MAPGNFKLRPVLSILTLTLLNQTNWYYVNIT